MSRICRKDADLVFLIVGKSCNFNCSYCIQGDSHRVTDKVEISPEVIDYLNGFHNRVTFYGGEPMLYFDQIKEILVKTRNSNNSYSLMTNGSLIRKSHIEFLNYFDVNLHVSWDGYNSRFSRYRDVMRENWGVLRFSNKLWIPSVIHSMNYPGDILEAANELDEDYFSLHGYHLNVFLNPIIKRCENKIFDVDYSRIRNDIKKVIACPDTHVKQALLTYAYNSYVGWLGSDDYLYKCGHCIALGLDGTVYQCKNSDKVFGRIKDLDNWWNWQVAHDLNKNHDCVNCSVFPFCRGGCRILDKYQEEFCLLQKAFFEPLADWAKFKHEQREQL